MGKTLHTWSVVCALVWLCTGCAALPSQPVQRALYVDAVKALNGESRLGWTVDRVEIEESAGQAEPSACRVPKEQRKGLRDWVEARIAEQGGPAEAQYKAGVDIDDLDDVIDLERTRALLDEVEAHLPADCPFWVKEEKSFGGIHQTSRRFVLIAESVGGGSLVITEGKTRAAGGGGARIMPSYGINSYWQIAAGIEVGGEAILEKTEEGSLEPVGAFRTGIPVELRLTDVDRIYDLELALVNRFRDGEITPLGGRAALAGGVSGLRRLGFMPAIQIWLAYEHYPAQDQQPASHVLRLGTKVGIDWDP